MSTQRPGLVSSVPTWQIKLFRWSHLALGLIAIGAIVAFAIAALHGFSRKWQICFSTQESCGNNPAWNAHTLAWLAPLVFLLAVVASIILARAFAAVVTRRIHDTPSAFEAPTQANPAPRPARLVAPAAETDSPSATSTVATSSPTPSAPAPGAKPETLPRSPEVVGMRLPSAEFTIPIFVAGYQDANSHKLQTVWLERKGRLRADGKRIAVITKEERILSRPWPSICYACFLPSDKDGEKWYVEIGADMVLSDGESFERRVVLAVSPPAVFVGVTDGDRLLQLLNQRLSIPLVESSADELNGAVLWPDYLGVGRQDHDLTQEDRGGLEPEEGLLTPLGSDSALVVAETPAQRADADTARCVPGRHRRNVRRRM